MSVDFSFDKNLVEASGYTLNDIYETLKKRFAEKNIPCVEEGEILSFAGGNHKNDFSHMWSIILRLTKMDWFLNFANSCIWHEDNNKWEDVLRQVKTQKMSSTAFLSKYWGGML